MRSAVWAALGGGLVLAGATAAAAEAGPAGGYGMKVIEAPPPDLGARPSFGFTKLVVADLDRALRFYTEVMGMREAVRITAPALYEIALKYPGAAEPQLTLVKPIPAPARVEVGTAYGNLGIYTTDLAEDEIITHVRISTEGARASAYEKFPHPASHLPLAGVAVVLAYRSGRLTDEHGHVTDFADGSIAQAAIAVTGISPRPYRARAAEAVLKGAFPTEETLAAAAAQVTIASPGSADRVSLLGDQHASAGYRAHLAEVLTRRALAKAIARGGQHS